MVKDILALLRPDCPDENCSYFGTGWNELKLHVGGGEYMDSLCGMLVFLSTAYGRPKPRPNSDLCIQTKKALPMNT